MTRTVAVRVLFAGDVQEDYFADVSQAADRVARTWQPHAERTCPGAVLVDAVEDSGHLVVRADVPDERAAQDVAALVAAIAADGELGFEHAGIDVLQDGPRAPFRE